MASIIIHSLPPVRAVLDPNTPTSEVFDQLALNITHIKDFEHPVLVSIHETTKVLGFETYDLVAGDYSRIFFRSFGHNIGIPVQPHYTIEFIKQLLFLHDYGHPDGMVIIHGGKAIPNIATVESAKLLMLDNIFIVFRDA